jgi:hypothetical protein
MGAMIAGSSNRVTLEFTCCSAKAFFIESGSKSRFLMFLALLRVFLYWVKFLVVYFESIILRSAQAF